MSYIDWGLSLLHPRVSKIQHESNTCGHCVSHNIPQGTHKANTAQLHCSAFEIYPDHSHVRMFPVNCTAKYWSRVLCEDRQQSVHMTKPAIGFGEYWTDNYAVLQREYMCPFGFNFVVHEVCLKLILIETKWLVRENVQGPLSFDYSKVSIHTGKCIDICKLKDKGQCDDVFMHYYRRVIANIVDEFYPKGSEFFINRVQSLWLPRPNFPSYISCARSRHQVKASNISNISVYTCQDGSVIADTLVCNGIRDCNDAEDEQHCSACSWTKPLLSACKCNIKFYYQCESGWCIHYDQMCDSLTDCPDGDDGIFCKNKVKFPHFDRILHSKSLVSDLCDPPLGDMLMCRTKLQWYNSSVICHYDHSRGVMAYCEDGSHMGSGSQCQFIECRRHYKC